MGTMRTRRPVVATQKVVWYFFGWTLRDVHHEVEYNRLRAAQWRYFVLILRHCSATGFASYFGSYLTHPSSSAQARHESALVTLSLKQKQLVSQALHESALVTLNQK
jgi:hypothetical protein